MNARWLTASLTVVVFLPTVVHAQYGQKTDRGAVLGGVTGALAGAAIGKHNKSTAVGALVGGAVGLATGAAIGNSMDKKTENQIQQQQQYQYQQQQTVIAQQAVSTYNVIDMTRSGVADSVIIAHIRENGVQRRIEVSDVIALHQQGVSEPVIRAMQETSVPRPTVVTPAPRYVSPAPVVIEERVYVTPRPYYYAPPHHYYHHHHHGPSHHGAHWGFSIYR